MKKILVALALILSLSSFQSEFANADSYDGFDVSEVLDLDEDDPVEGSTDIYENIIEEAEENNTSVAAAVMIRVVNVLSLLVGTLTFLIIFYAGFQMVTAGGDENKVDNAKNMLLQAITGAVIAFLAYFITTFVQSFFY